MLDFLFLGLVHSLSIICKIVQIHLWFPYKIMIEQSRVYNEKISLKKRAHAVKKRWSTSHINTVLTINFGLT